VRVEIQRSTFDPTYDQDRPTPWAMPARVARLRLAVGRQFEAVAGAMCARGRLSPAAFRRSAG
jgi:hypothetical protein